MILLFPIPFKNETNGVLKSTLVGKVYCKILHLLQGAGLSTNDVNFQRGRWVS